MSGAVGTEVNCLWQAGKEPEPAQPSVTRDERCDVAIIGGGYTGLSAAYHLKQSDPSLDVVILESETAGFGASGRNAGFVMTLFGASLPMMHSLHGKERVRQAHAYMEGAIHALEGLIAKHKIDCDYERNGFLKVATSERYVKRIAKEMELMHACGINGFEWLERDAVASRVRSQGFLGALYEPGCGILDPVKWMRGLKRIALQSGARLFERSPVTEVRKTNGGYALKTPGGTVYADKIIYATNGYTHLIPGLRTKQLPAFAYVIATEPLTPEQLATIGWQGREGIEDARNFMHFYRLTADNRLLAGGGPGLVPFNGNMDNDASPKAWAHLQSFIRKTFPSLKDVPIAYRWGGAFSVTSDSTPQIGQLDGGSAAYSIGCTGHGVAMTHQNGRILADLTLSKETPLSTLWFVNRQSFPIPPEPVRSLAARSAMAAMALDDWWCA